MRKFEMRYDPCKAPDPEAWLALGEQQRIDLVNNHHRKARVRLPNAQLHAVIHTIVENQVALGNEAPVSLTLQRLMGEGLDRHEAIHAIGSVLAQYLLQLLKEGTDQADPNADYYRKLEGLTAESWRQSGREPEGVDI